MVAYFTTTRKTRRSQIADGQPYRVKNMYEGELNG